ncbi:ABC transporter permease [Aurantimonas sp. C2-6-R+9]|uniref:ABC transporter permease n=1 Tax=unclassified Aurantimonas TaxID=2638230 RepID=UPI002E199C4C|nr:MULTISPECIES: ABC transporter permease [unclassified Aurantimonas]MEC5291168.1 ABC transporter permease [Aurantimonas sp. C2-3-R2]MEC5381495.1 ABC transporter permease [Aurantimonas sp. C2-6-R+9]MEC5411870.1 ABC transporter permease [Aurantimonas sp. C2-4-R8]
MSDTSVKRRGDRVGSESAGLAAPGARALGSTLPRLIMSGRLGSMILALVLPVVLVVIWQLAGTNGSLFGGVLPTPDRVVKAWWMWAFGERGMGLNPYSGTWLANVLFSTQRVAQGFAVAILIGVPAGIMIGWNRLSAQVLDPTIQLLRPVPITAWLPFSIAVFGIESFGAIFLIALGAFYPIVINTTQGARHVERNLVRAALMMGANRFDILRCVVVPAALPSIFTGLRIGLGIGWTAVIVAEMIAVKSGLGYVLWDAYYVGRMDVVIADMVSIGLMGLLSDQLILLVERWALSWRLAVASR